MFTNWTKGHVIALGMCLISIGGMGANLASWAEAIQPAFVFSAAGAIGSVLVAIYSDNASKKE